MSGTIGSAVPLYAFRRHAPGCKFHGRSDARHRNSCGCPVWVDGYHEDRRVRRSLKTRSMSKARVKLAAIEEELEAGQLPARNRTMVDATTSLEDYCKSELAFSTYRKNRNVMRQLRSFAGECHIIRVRDWTTELLDRYRAGREVGRVTALKELEIIRQFFSFCLDRGWAKSNPAAAIKTPRNVRPTDKRPYTLKPSGRLFGRPAKRSAGQAMNDSAHEGCSCCSATRGSAFLMSPCWSVAASRTAESGCVL